MSIVERKINIVNTPIELIVYLVRDISSDYVSMDEYMKTWIYDIYENKIFNYLVNKNEEIKWENTMPPLYDKHIDIIKYLIFKTTKSINKYLSFFMCNPSKYSSDRKSRIGRIKYRIFWNSIF